MAPTHFFDGRSCQPLCGTTASHSWNWTCDPRAVTCPDCSRLVVQAASRSGSLADVRPNSLRF